MKRKQAEQLLRELVNFQSVVHDPRYWHRGFHALFCQYCDDQTFEDPQAGLTLARIALQLAERIQPDLEPRVQALCVLGSAFRATSRLEDADATYRQVERLTRDSSSIERCEYQRRLAYLRCDQRRFEEALQLIEKAIRIHRLEGSLIDRHPLGCALLARGYVQYQTGESGMAVRDISQSLNLINPQNDNIYYYAAIHNLAVAIIGSDLTHQDDLATGISYLKHARRMLSYRRLALPKLMLRWTEGILCERLCLSRNAERCFLTARRGFVKHAVPFDLALVSLDLAKLYVGEGRFYEARQLAAETISVFQSLSSNTDALTALLVWQHAEDEELNRGLLASVRHRLEAWVQVKPS